MAVLMLLHYCKWCSIKFCPRDALCHILYMALKDIVVLNYA